MDLAAGIRVLHSWHIRSHIISERAGEDTRILKAEEKIMSVGKRGKFYWMVFMYNGTRIQKTTRCTSRRDAEEVERAYRTQLAKGEVGFEKKKPIPRFRDAMKEYLSWAQVGHSASRNTQLRAATSSKALLRYFEDAPLDQVTVDSVEKFKEWRRIQKKQPPNKKGGKQKRTKTAEVIKPATVNRELACLRAMLNYYIRKDVLGKNPVSRVKFLKEENTHMRVLSVDEERLYFMACSQPLQDVATVMIDTGMRPSEVCKLQRCHVNVEKGLIIVDQGKTRSARRKIPLTDRSLKILERRVRNFKDEFLFPGMRGGENPHVIKLNNAHKAALSRAGIKPFRIYDLRHTFATRAAEAGVDLVTLAALLGHSRVQMLMRYAHPTEQHQFEAIKRIERLRQKSVAIA